MRIRACGYACFRAAVRLHMSVAVRVRVAVRARVRARAIGTASFWLSASASTRNTSSSRAWLTVEYNRRSSISRASSTYATAVESASACVCVGTQCERMEQAAGTSRRLPRMRPDSTKRMKQLTFHRRTRR